MIYNVLKNYSAVFASNYDPTKIHQPLSDGFPTSVEGGGVIPRAVEGTYEGVTK